MQTEILTILVLVSMILLSSCNDNLEENQISVSNDDEMNLVQSITILSFENEAAFLESVEKLRVSSNPASHLTRSASENDFYSLYREFDQAMEEADYKAFTEEKVNFTSKRKMWVTLRGVKHDAQNHLAYAGQLKEARIDVCFRKKVN